MTYNKEKGVEDEIEWNPFPTFAEGNGCSCPVGHDEDTTLCPVDVQWRRDIRPH